MCSYRIIDAQNDLGWRDLKVHLVPSPSHGQGQLSLSQVAQSSIISTIINGTALLLVLLHLLCGAIWTPNTSFPELSAPPLSLQVTSLVMPRSHIFLLLSPVWKIWYHVSRLDTPDSIRQDILAGGWMEEYWTGKCGFIYIQVMLWYQVPHASVCISATVGNYYCTSGFCQDKSSATQEGHGIFDITLPLFY